MENYNNIVKSVISEDLTTEQVVSLIELLSNLEEYEHLINTEN